MSLFLLLSAVVVGLHALVLLSISFAVARLRAVAPAAPPHPLPRVAVVVAARNEEQDLPRCAEALLGQNYPAEKLTIFLADDHSTDRTPTVIRQIANAAPAEGPSVVRVDVPDAAGELRGKANALHAGIEAGDQELILVTDADCAPPPDWVRNHVAYFADTRVGMVCGHAHVEARGTWERVQALDWTYLLTAASVFSEYGRPVTAMGNNMGFRRSAYEATGGYPALPFSVTEDYVLFRTVAHLPSVEVRFPLDPGLRTITLALTGFRAVYAQRRRWARGGLGAPAWVRMLYVLSLLAHLLPLVALPVALVPALAMLGGKLGADFLYLWTAVAVSGRSRLLGAFLPFEFYLFAYTVTLPFALLVSRRITWKDREM